MMRKIPLEFILLIALLCFASFLFFYNLGENYLTNWDEAWYADISRNISREGNLLTPIWNKEPFFDKPPLYFWLSTIAFKIFGEREFSARFFSALSGIGTVFALYFFARMLFNREVAIASSLILISTIGFLYRARTGNLDLLLAFLILFSIFSFFKAYLSIRANWWYLLMGVSLAAGFLTKGAISFLFPAVVIVYLISTKDFKTLKSKYYLGGISIGIVISLLWITLSYIINGYQFISDFMLNQTGKFTTTSFFWKNFSFEYVFHLKSGLKIWFLLFIPSLIYIFITLKHFKLKIIIIYFFVFFLVLSFSENKNNWFLVPLYPIISLMIGYSLFAFFQKLAAKYHYIFMMGFLLIVMCVQIVVYKNEFIVPNVAASEAKVALAGKESTKEDEVIYLTNYYYPTTVYYSERKVYAVYSDHDMNQAWWVKPKSEFKKIVSKPNSIIITTREELAELKDKYPNAKFETLFISGDKLLVKSL